MSSRPAALWYAAATVGAGLGLALFCGAGAASAEVRHDADRAAGAAHAEAAPRQSAGRHRSEAPNAKAVNAVRAGQRITPVATPQVSVTLPQIPVTGGRSFTVSPESITDVARDYLADGGDPLDAPRFFFGDLAVTSLERLAEPAATPDQVEADLGSLSVSGYFGGVWLRDNLRATEPVPAPDSGAAPVDLTVPALAIGLFDQLAAGLTQAARSQPWIGTSVAHATVPVLLALYGYNRGYLEFLLENPPAGVPSMRGTLACTGFLGCSSSAFPLELDTRYDGAPASLATPSTPGWWEMKAWSAVLQGATGSGRAVWQLIAGQSGFAPASYAALVDLSSAFLMVSKAAVLSAMLAAADGDAGTAAESLRLQAGLWMWAGSYFGGLASAAPPGTIPSISTS